MKGYKKNSPDRNNPMNIIPSGKITMIEDDGTPLAHPVMAIKPDGGQVVMQPGKNYDFGKGPILEVPVMQSGGAMLYDYDDMFGKLAKTKPLPIAQYGGDQVYTFSGRQDSKYKNVNGKWHIQNKDTDNKFVEIEDPSGKRSAVLNKQTKPLNSNNISPEQQKGWDDLGKKLVLPKQKIPTNMAEAEQMMARGELYHESISEIAAREKREAADRKNQRVKSLSDYEKRYNNPNYNQFTGLPGESYRDNLAKEAESLDAKFRVSQEDNLFDDYLNPAVWVGSMAKALGEAPKKAKETDSYMPYVTSIGAPLLAGAMGGLGASGNKQFVNNLVNPVAGMKVPFTNKTKQIVGEQIEQLSKTTVPKNVNQKSLLGDGVNAKSPTLKKKSYRYSFDDNPDAFEKFAMENPERVRHGVQDDWSDVPLERQSRDLQKQSFDMATDFSNKWVSKDPEKHLELQNELYKLRQSNVYPENSDRITNDYFYKSNEAQSEFLKENNLTNKDLFDFDTPRGLELQKEYSKYSDEYMAKNYPELYEKRQNIYKIGKEHDSKIENLEKVLEENIDPEFRKKVIDIYSKSDGNKKHDFSTIQAGNLKLDKKPVLVYGDKADESYANLSLDDQKYLDENWNRIGGVKTDNDTITIGSTPVKTEYVVQSSVPLHKKFNLYNPNTWQNPFAKKADVNNLDPTNTEIVELAHQKMVDPDEIAGVNAHEIGHDHQTLYRNWIDQIQEYNPKFEYYTGHDKNELAKTFKEALVDPALPKNGSYAYDTWKSGAGEVHSELMKARLKVAKKYIDKEGLSLDDAIHYVKSLEAKGDDDLYDFYLKEGNLDKHFKRKASKETKKAILKALPVAIPAIGTAAAVAAGSNSPSATNIQEQKYGGSVEDLFKFFR